MSDIRGKKYNKTSVALIYFLRYIYCVFYQSYHRKTRYSVDVKKTSKVSPPYFSQRLKIKHLRRYFKEEFLGVLWIARSGLNYWSDNIHYIIVLENGRNVFARFLTISVQSRSLNRYCFYFINVCVLYYGPLNAIIFIVMVSIMCYSIYGKKTTVKVVSSRRRIYTCYHGSLYYVFWIL